MDPFKTQELQGIVLKLGEDRNLKFKLTLETIYEEVTVEASNPIISEGRTGASQNVSTGIIESMPSIGRSFDDFARLAPQVDARGSGAFSSAGKSNKYNNIQIDGAVNNDLFGLGSSGTPGLAGPISLDAVQEFQLVIAPYDVRQGGFTGSSLNAITRSGTNMFAGSAYYFGRNQDFVGKGPDQTAYGTFSEKQYGFRLGGPVIKDKLFFFLSGEMGDRSSPTTWIIDDSGNSNDFGGTNVNKADADRFVSILKNTYGYDPGGYGAGYKDMASDNSKIFVRLDYNISDKHRLTLRHNYVNGTQWNNPSKASNTVFPFGDVYYQLTNKTNSTVLQLNSTLGKNLFNELTLNYTTIRDSRATGDDIFPQVNVAIAGGYRLTAGTEQYSGANGLNQDIIEITDNLTLYSGKHTFTLGTHNELFDFANLYIRNYYGYWEFNSLNDFENGKAVALLPRLHHRQPHGEMVGQIRRQAAGRLRRRQLVGAAQPHADPWRAPRRADHQRHPDRQPRGRAGLRHQDRPGGFGQPALLAPRRLQLGRLQGQENPGPRRHRHLLRPHPLRLDLQPVLQQRHRLHPL